MLKNSSIVTLLFILTISTNFYSQSDSIEVFIIDAFVTPEKPHTLNISFFTSEEVKTKILINNSYKLSISDEFVEDHTSNIDFTKYRFNKKFVPYRIISEKKNGIIEESEQFEIVLPYEEFIETKEGADPISTVLFGIFLYLLPSPSYMLTEDEDYFTVTKEFPLVTFYSSGYNIPAGNISFEYTHVYKSSVNNFLRFGYKHYFSVPIFEYISPGLTGFTNFNGFNGLGAEISLGLFNIYDVFTVYSRYRYNAKPNNLNQNFQEISIGLYSHFFTIDI